MRLGKVIMVAEHFGVGVDYLLSDEDLPSKETMEIATRFNGYTEETVDYFPFVLRYESLTGEKERQDAKLTASFAKKLSMMQKNQKGDAARNYFVGVENGAKNLISQYKALSPTEHPGEVANLIKAVTSRMDKQGSAPYESMDVPRMLCEQYGIQLPESIVKVPECEQMKLEDFIK